MPRHMWAGRELRNRHRAPARLSFWGEVVAATETRCTSVIMKKLGFGGICWRTVSAAATPVTKKLARGCLPLKCKSSLLLWRWRHFPEGAPDELWRLLGRPTRRSACYHMENSTLEEEKSLALTLQSPSSALYWQSLTSSKGEMYFARSNSSVIK